MYKPPKVVDISGELPSVGSNGTRRDADLRQLVVHHSATGSVPSGQPFAKKVLSSFAHFHVSKGWKHIAYHLAISTDGTIYQTLPLNEVGFHAGNWLVNRTGIGIVLIGDLDKAPPDDRQLDSLRALLADLCYHRPDLPGVVRSQIFCHREVRIPPFSTSCPGRFIAPTVSAWRRDGIIH